MYTPTGEINWELFGGQATWSNPLAATFIHASAVTDNLISNLNLNYQVVKGLYIKVGLGYTHDQMDQNILTPSTSQSPPYNGESSRDYRFGNNELKTWIAESQLDYHKKIGMANWKR